MDTNTIIICLLIIGAFSVVAGFMYQRLEIKKQETLLQYKKELETERIKFQKEIYQTNVVKDEIKKVFLEKLKPQIDNISEQIVDPKTDKTLLERMNILEDKVENCNTKRKKK